MRDRDALREDIAALIERLAGGGRDEAARDALFEEVAAWQRAHVPAYERLCRARGGLAAMPTDVFRHVRVASHPDEEDVRVFLTSGTTSGARGRHAHADLSLYDRAAYTAADYALFPDGYPPLVMLAPHPDEAPESSLSYMLGLFAARAPKTSWVWHDGALDLDALDAVLREAEQAGEPVALLGTSFAFVHAEDGLGDRRYALPPKSRVMQTGGYKGRSREIAPAVLRQAIAERYGVDEAWVVAEYGMTELSSQMYELTPRGEPAPRRFWVPGWVRVTAVDPATLARVPDGEVGVLRIDDLANLDSVCAIQTSDLAIVRGGSLELIGRAPGATPRGCSLAVEEALGE